MDVKPAAAAFLAQKRIAVTGVSRTAAGHGGNTVYQRLRERGYDVFAVNPNAEQVEGDPVLPRSGFDPRRCRRRGHRHPTRGGRGDHASAPSSVSATCGCTVPSVRGSVCDEATVQGREHGITVIDGGCPLMFEPVSDVAHRIMRPLLTMTGKVPRLRSRRRVVTGVDRERCRSRTV